MGGVPPDVRFPMTARAMHRYATGLDVVLRAGVRTLAGGSGLPPPTRGVAAIGVRPAETPGAATANRYGLESARRRD